MNKPKVKHLIRLVEDKEICRRKIKRLTLHKVDKAARCGDDDIGALGHAGNLWIDGHAPNHKTNLHRRAFDKDHKVVTDLVGKLAGRRKDKTAHGFRLGLAPIRHKPRHERQTKGKGLTRAGLCKPHHVAPIKRMGDRPGLNRGRCGNPGLFKP